MTKTQTIDPVTAPAPPSPRGAPVIGNIRELQQDNIAAFMNGFNDCGDVIRYRGPLRIDLFAHPDDVKHVLMDEHRRYPRPLKVQGCLQTIVGSGLVAAEGDDWRQARRLAQPAFHRQMQGRFTESFVAGTKKLIERWEQRTDRDEPIDVKSAMMNLSLTNLAQALFRTDWTADLGRIEPAVVEALRYTNHRMTSPIDPYRFPTPARKRFRGALSTINSVLYPLIDERRHQQGDDLVSMLVGAKDSDTGAGFTDDQIRDQVSGFFVAGHETVSSAFSWTWYLLSQYPDAWRRIHREAIDVLGDRDPTIEDLPKLRYTTMVIQEAMRLYPPIFVYMRCAAEDDTVRGYHIPAGRWIVVCPYVTHRHPEFWDNPEAFDPERFTPERSAGRHRLAYLPFGAGPRKCIGENFADAQMPIAIAMLARRFRLDLVEGQTVVPEPAISLRPRGSMMMRVRTVEDSH